MLEADFTRDVCNDLRRHNAMVFAIVGGQMQEPGWPDRIVWHSTWAGFLEFKGEKTPLELKQKIILRGLNRRKLGSAYVVRWPGLIQDYKGNTLATFDGTGKDLLRVLVTAR